PLRSRWGWLQKPSETTWQVGTIPHLRAPAATARPTPRDGTHPLTIATGIKIDAMTLLGEHLRDGPKNTGGGDGSNQHRRATGSQREQVAQPPTREELLGKGGRKVAGDDPQGRANALNMSRDMTEAQRAVVAAKQWLLNGDTRGSGRRVKKAESASLAQS